ncbi:MAG TPA: menaquinone biosynthesis decarboxylase [Candidatus Polarisedimenticolia bacterium]|nr:menaquinone biosynthesis decarboxylase [Candidatus Polarisedimenticolia bacterium]
MAHADLRAFLSLLEQKHELVRIQEPVSADLEISAIADRVSKSPGGGPALLFEKVQGHPQPVLINALGSIARMKLALEVDDLDAFGARIDALLDSKAPASLLDKIRLLPKLKDLSDLFPVQVRKGACQEVVERENPSLLSLPVLKCWPGDAGRYITLPLVFTRDPETGVRNCGIYRMQVFDARTAGMHWQIHKHGAHHHRLSEERSRRLEVACALGADPALVFAAAAPLPDGVDEMFLAGFVRREPVPMVRCVSVDVEVPATAEIVLEGYVDPQERRREGPFGDHTGYYSLADEYPVFHLTCVTHRERPIYQTTIVGPPPMEDFAIGKAIERIFLPLMKRQLPEIVDIHMPAQGIFHNLILVALRKRYPGHARKVMHAIWGMGQAMFSKVIVVVDDDVDVQDVAQVAWKALNHIDPERDIEFVLGPVDVLDHAARLPQYGSHMGVDATRKWPGEGFTRPWPDEIRMDAETLALVERKWTRYGIG